MQIRRLFVLPIIIVVLALVLVACGGSNSDSSSNANETAADVDEASAGDDDHDENAENLDDDDAEAHDESDDGDDHESNDPLTVAAVHAIPEEAAAKVNPIAYDEASVAAGAEIFAQTCTVCHGPEGKGDGPGAAGLDPKPAELFAEHVQANSDGALFYTISEGRPDTSMVSWKQAYSETERWQLVNFIRSLAAE